MKFREKDNWSELIQYIQIGVGVAFQPRRVHLSASGGLRFLTESALRPRTQSEVLKPFLSKNQQFRCGLSG